MSSDKNNTMTSGAIDVDKRSRFDRLCGSFRGDLLRFSLWMTRDAALAEDVVQETLIRAWNHLDALKDEAAARAWLLTIVRREVSRMFRRKKHEMIDIDALSGSEATMLATRATPEIFEVRKAIWSLSDEYREPLVLQVLFGFSAQEIADRMGMTIGAVLVRLFRARNKLREILAPDPGGGKA